MTFFLFNDTATTEIYTLSLHDALPIWAPPTWRICGRAASSALASVRRPTRKTGRRASAPTAIRSRSEEHTSELQSLAYLVCRLLLEKKNKHHHRSDL